MRDDRQTSSYAGICFHPVFFFFRKGFISILKTCVYVPMCTHTMQTISVIDLLWLKPGVSKHFRQYINLKYAKYISIIQGHHGTMKQKRHTGGVTPIQGLCLGLQFSTLEREQL